MPVRFLKEVYGLVSPYTVSVINMSQLTDSVPVYFKNAIVQPLLKKPSLDPNSLYNFKAI